MKLLIITVGTRQLGWRCSDDVVRSFGADNGREIPAHVDALFEAIGVERGEHSGQSKTRHGLAELSRLYYELFADSPADLQSAVFLIDQPILDCIARDGVDRIILWGTCQPETVDWQYRRWDTYWLAKLMAAAIQAQWPTLANKVEVFAPVVTATDRQSIREELESFLFLDFYEQKLAKAAPDSLTLWIENKGSVPAIAEGLAVAAGGLSRQATVQLLIPDDPADPFLWTENGDRSAAVSPGFQTLSLNRYFWPLERLRVRSAWQRGDFDEACLWLEPHREQYETLFTLASLLKLGFNWEQTRFLQEVSRWLNSRAVKANVSEGQLERWKNHVQLICDQPLYGIRENWFVVQTLFLRGDYSTAFLIFAQTVERTLYMRSQTENWKFEESLREGSPTFWLLIETLARKRNVKREAVNNNWYQLLHAVREGRNKVVHEAQPVDLAWIRGLWTQAGFSISMSVEIAGFLPKMEDLLAWVIDDMQLRDRRPLLAELSQWGLDQINAEIPQDQTPSN